ncbi:MAG: hypothetical protein M1324_00115 [Patescibacteria group bacterium]|nr:hypothetical protein [Patescibacteria group bacterium]
MRLEFSQGLATFTNFAFRFALGCGGYLTSSTSIQTIRDIVGAADTTFIAAF